MQVLAYPSYATSLLPEQPTPTFCLDWVHTGGILPPSYSPRSPAWHRLALRHLADQPFCIVCGGSSHVQVHHVKPFHLYPKLELDPKNLRTMCMHPDRRCHFLWGHGKGEHGNWSWNNPKVDEDAARELTKWQSMSNLFHNTYKASPEGFR